MILYNVILLLRQLRRLIDNHVRYADLSNVVQKPHHIYVLELLFLISKSFRDLSGIIRDPGGVSVGVGVLGVNG